MKKLLIAAALVTAIFPVVVFAQQPQTKSVPSSDQRRIIIDEADQQTPEAKNDATASRTVLYGLGAVVLIVIVIVGAMTLVAHSRNTSHDNKKL